MQDLLHSQISRSQSKPAQTMALDVLDGVLIAVTQQSLEEIIKNSITISLNMTNTGFTLPDNHQPVTHYHDDLSQPLPIPSPYCMQLDESWNNGILSYNPKHIFNPEAYHSGGSGIVGNPPDFMQFILSLISSSDALSSGKLMDKMVKYYIIDLY